MLIKIKDKKYPNLLKKIPDPPSELFYKGNLEDSFFNNTLAVVGSRKMTSYGKKATEELVSLIAEQGITIVSGFMYGIDAIAHRAALDVGGKTIAVMPCGIDIIHPAYQKKLYKEIAEKGLILSEYKNKLSSEKWIYPRRNRIVAGLSKAILIVEAAEKSGSLITARLALKYKRKLFSVPGSIFNPMSTGTNEIIKNKLVEPVTCAKDVLSFFRKIDNKKIEHKFFNLTEKEKKVVYLLSSEPLELNIISEKTKISISETSSILSTLELKEIIKRGGLKYYIK